MSKADALRLPEYLRHIREAIERIQHYAEDMDEVAFLKDQKTQDAVIRNFEVIGEASRNIERYHKQFADEHEYLPLQPTEIVHSDQATARRHQITPRVFAAAQGLSEQEV